MPNDLCSVAPALRCAYKEAGEKCTVPATMKFTPYDGKRRDGLQYCDLHGSRQYDRFLRQGVFMHVERLDTPEALKAAEDRQYLMARDKDRFNRAMKETKRTKRNAYAAQPTE